MISKFFKIILWNTNGLKPKLTELTTYLTCNDIDIALLTETKLTPTDTIKIKNYNIYRNDRLTHGGGVAIIVKNTIHHTHINTQHTTLEIVGIKLKNNTHIYSLYIPPNHTLTHNQLDNIFNRHNKVLIAGDLNSRHTAWNNHVNNTNGNTLYTYYLQNNINIHHTQEPTHFPPNGTTPTYIDIILNKNVNEVSDPHTEIALSSDHNPVRFEILTERNDIKTPQREIRTFKNTNWTAFKQELNRKTIINNNITNKAGLNKVTEILTNTIQKVMDKHSTTQKITHNNSEIPDNIKQQIARKNATRREWQRTRDPLIRRTLNEQVRSIKEKLSEYYNLTWQNTLEKINEKNDNGAKLWKIIKRLKRPALNMPALEHNGKTYYSNLEKANIIAQNLAEIQSNTAQSDIENVVQERIRIIENTTNNEGTEELLTTPAEIRQIIKTLPNNKAPGPDRIPNIILKNLPQKPIVQLTYIINSIFKLQIYPDPWKTAQIIPIHKKDKPKNNPNSYRPISLLNSLSKIAEKIIHKRILKEEAQRKIIIDEQFGFRPGHNTTLQAVRISHDILENFNKEKVTIMTLLDIQKAFDTVWTDGLIYKMDSLQIKKPLVKLIKSYLEDRYIQVKLENETSTRHRTLAGVPQGSVLGPTLFNLFINDIPKFEKTSIAIYADDTAIYAHSYYAQAALLQNQIHLDRIIKHFEKWKININPEKTENITFSRKFTNIRTFKKLKVKDIEIEPKTCVKYLGVWMDKSLRFHIHAEKTVKKFHAALRALYPLLNKRSKLTIENKKKIYTAILRPTLTYAAPILTIASNTQKTKLQRLQNKSLRLVLTADRYTPIHQLHEQLNIQTLTEHIHQLTTKFYNSVQNSPLTTHLNTPSNYKHKLPFQFLTE